MKKFYLIYNSLKIKISDIIYAILDIYGFYFY